MRYTGLLLLFAFNCLALALAMEPRMTLTAQENGVEPQDTFTCSDTIHGYLMLPDLAIGKHQLEGVWTLPNGKVIEHSRIPIDFPPPGRSTAYLWLKFPEQAPTLLALDPAEDQQRLSFNGPWQLQVLWDDKPLLHTSFKVRCS